MASSGNWNLQKGVYEALTSDASVTGLLGGANIFATAPQSANYPYLTFGESVNPDWSASSGDGEERTLTLHVWSRAGGEAETHDIIKAIQAVLQNGPVAVNDDHRVSLRHEFTGARQDPNDETFHGIVRYRAVTEPMAA